MNTLETKSTTVDTDTVRDMALEHMSKTFTYRGRDYNMNDLGWRFAFSNKKRALGTCDFGRKVIYVSQWFIENGSREMDMWVNTMVHEISHAINHILGGKNHDWQWQNIFITLGGNGNRTSGDNKFGDLIKNPVSKYTTICPNGHTSASHKVSRAVVDGRRACGRCCKEHNNGKFSSKYTLRQIKNY
jgi:hypothetical protein